MSNFSFLAREIREVGESVFSNSQDLFLLLNVKVSNDAEGVAKIRHGVNLVENILSILMYLSTLDLEMLDRHEELLNEMDKIKYSCHELQSALSKFMESGKPTLYNKKYLGKLLTSVKNSANKIITISYLLEQESNDIDSYLEESHNICYEDRKTCEQYCPNGFCIEENAKVSEQQDSSCPDYIESFTQSSLTNVENGYEGNEHMPWHVKKDILGVKESNKYTIWDTLKVRLYTASISKDFRKGSGSYVSQEKNHGDSLITLNEVPDENNVMKEIVTEDGSKIQNNEITNNAPKLSVDDKNKIKHENYFEHYLSENESTTISPDFKKSHSHLANEHAEKTTSSSHSERITAENCDELQCNDKTISYSSNEETTATHETTTYSYEITTSTDDITTSTIEATTPSYETTTHDYETSSSFETTTYCYETTIYDETTTSSYETTTPNYETTYDYETTTYGYETTTLGYETTTLSYETTTQDMYKLSQDIYQAAQDLSSKSSELSSMSSEISSKSSDISSIVSELNNYEDDELSKKIQGVSKLTQEINSKTSEISSLTSTMSSLSSDISSASSDMTSADRHHAFRTTPWQKMAGKSDELITNAQAVVTAAQDILAKVTEVVSATADLKVATSVANMAGQITAKTQRLISEALSIVSKVIELASVIDSS